MDVLYGCMDFSSSKIRESVKFDIRAYIERCRSEYHFGPYRPKIASNLRETEIEFQIS
jgi:hypothetical protein